MVLYCAHILLGWKKIKTLYPPSLSKAGAFTLESHIALEVCRVSLMVLCFFSYDTTIGFLWDVHGNSLDFLWDFTGMSMRCTLDFYWICMRFPWNFYRISMVFFYGIYYGFLWNFCMRCLWYFHEISIKFLLDSFGIPMICLCYFYGIPMGFW